MGERATIDQDYLYDIADAIREKKGVTTRFIPAEMKPAILSIPTGGITPTGTVQITQNGTHDVTEYASANVNVQPNLQSKTVTQNGTVTPDQGYDGLSSVVVDVSGGGSITPIAMHIRSQAFISGNSTINWTSPTYPNYKQFWMDLLPYQGRTLEITNTGNRDMYGYTSVEPYDGLALNAARIDSGGSLTVTYNGGADRYLVYDFSADVDGGLVSVSVR